MDTLPTTERTRMTRHRERQRIAPAELRTIPDEVRPTTAREIAATPQRVPQPAPCAA
ncbi:hypothetical protein [Rathayibacter agropyri]|uniref:hypothetical protein n=1 Tax=Rathayibacter agropyri TaxID=1634927 RepID=UPI0015663519|nr:hypothetical protein [Rathayibacter agropyri]NRD08444.1 hypothetical protein [Rathayibacter agropyri]